MPKDAPADQALIEAIAKLLNEQNLAEIEIEREDLRVRVTRSYASTGVQQVMMPAAPPPAPPPAAHHTAPAGSAAKAAGPADDLGSNPGTLPSPMVGTASLSPEPGKAAFVAVGARVSEGQTILIIEAMKTMNQIPAHKSGIVTRLLVDDSSPVEYGQPLAVIE